MKILIADDSQFMRQILKELLEKQGYEVLEAENGKIAIEKVKSESPDLLLLDIIMPEMDGLEVLAETEVKTIVISAVGQEKMVEEAKAAGALDYIVKPFENEQVLQVIEKVLAG
jgi:two-component system, chemotaxis family, chemotaxis protein CheY